MARAFDPNQNGVASAMNDFGKQLGVTLSDPDTWIFIIGTIASIAALVLSGGTAGPVVIAALGALGPTMNIIGNVAQGRPVDPFDIAAMAFAIIPGAAAAGGFDDAVRAGIAATKAAAPAAKAAALGNTLAKAAAITNRVNNVAVRTGLLAKLRQVSDLATSITKVGNKARVLVKNPGSIKTLLFGQRGWEAIGPVLTNLEKAQQLAARGLSVIKTGVQIAKIGEGLDLWQIPDITIPLEDINWDNPPEDVQYVFELETGEDEKKKAEFAKAQAEANRVFQEKYAEDRRKGEEGLIRRLEQQRLAVEESAAMRRRVEADVERGRTESAALRKQKEEDEPENLRRREAAMSGGPRYVSVEQERRDEAKRRIAEYNAQNGLDVPLPTRTTPLTEEELLRNKVFEVEEQIVNALRYDPSLDAIQELNKLTQEEAVRQGVLERNPEWVEKAYAADSKLLTDAGIDPSQYTPSEVAQIASQLKAQGMGRRVRKQKSRR